MRKYYSAASLLVVAAVMWLMTGVITLPNRVCLSCHSGNVHVVKLASEPHEKVSCVRCHEANGLAGSVTTGLPARMIHITVGTFRKTDVPGYRQFPQYACQGCHSELVSGDEVFNNPETGIQMSHADPLDAGMVCTDCHSLDENKKVSAKTPRMQICLLCHSQATTSVDCTVCHYLGTKMVRSSKPRTENASALVAKPASDYCYRCHDSRPCDTCHGGYRMPHPLQYSGTKHGVDATKNGVESCLLCHSKVEDDRWKKPGNCANCHGDSDPWF